MEGTGIEGDTCPSQDGVAKYIRISSVALSDRPMEEKHLEGEHLVIACQLAHDSSSMISCFTLLYDGATGFTFMDEAFARCH